MVRIIEYTEGKTTFLSADIDYYSEDQHQPTTDLPVFMNPRMQINRDLSVLFLDAYMREHDVELICEPLAGSGVRTLRYLNEIEGDFRALMFDINPVAVETATRNIQQLKFEDRCQVKKGDAKVLLITESREKRFNYVDVDPFGSPAQFLNASIQSLKPRGGLLALTATDTPALCGVWPNVALRKYGGYSIRAPFSHEIAVRLLLGLTYQIAGMNDKSIEPLVSLSTDHYVRVWVHVVSQRSRSNQETGNIGFIRYCPTCVATDILSIRDSLTSKDMKHEIDDCNGKVRIAGPLWIGPLFSHSFLSKSRDIYSEERLFHKRVSRILDEMIDESRLIGHVYTDIHTLCDVYSLTPAKNEMISLKLDERGYRVSRTHFKPTAIRTDAPISEIVSIIKDILEVSK